MIRLIFAVIFMLSITFCIGEEIKCSRFHYEEHTLSKIVRLEHKLELLEARIEKTENIKPRLLCPDTWIHFQDSCYLFPRGEFSFKDAEHRCVQSDSHLVDIESEEENTFLKNYMRDLKDSDYWSGLTKNSYEKWIWHESKKEASFTDWNNHSPNNSGGDQFCMFLQLNYDFQWNDMACGAKYRAVCERKVQHF